MKNHQPCLIEYSGIILSWPQISNLLSKIGFEMMKSIAQISPPPLQTFALQDIFLCKNVAHFFDKLKLWQIGEKMAISYALLVSKHTHDVLNVRVV